MSRCFGRTEFSLGAYPKSQIFQISHYFIDLIQFLSQNQTNYCHINEYGKTRQSRDCKDFDCQSMEFLQIKADANFANSTLFYDKKAKHVILTVQGQRKWITHTLQSPRRIQTSLTIVCIAFQDASIIPVNRWVPVMRTEANMSYECLIHRPIVDLSSADRKSLQLIKVIGEVCFNVIAPVGRQNCIYRPIKMQNSCRLVCINLIAAYIKRFR